MLAVRTAPEKAAPRRLRVAPVPHGERLSVRVGLCLFVPAAVPGSGKEK